MIEDDVELSILLGGLAGKQRLCSEDDHHRQRDRMDREARQHAAAGQSRYFEHAIYGFHCCHQFF
jgi:hypothetical protein